MFHLEPEFMDLTPHLDIHAFWAENDLCQAFSPNKPRCCLSFSPDDHWLFDFLPVESTLRYYNDKAYRDTLHRQANLILFAQVGRTYFDEDTWINSPRRIENLFGCEFTYIEGGTPWFVPVTEDPVEFERVLDRAEYTDLKSWALPEPFLEEWEIRKRGGQTLPLLGTGSRGPATVMTSILHPETFFYWIFDYPELIRRFRDLLAQKMVQLNRILRQFSTNNEPGWWITDDNCALFNRHLYAEYCVPILDQVLNTFAPAGSTRYQHSDSAMGHLLDQQHRLGINSVNYGPSVDAGLIRTRLPSAWIHGQLPPLLLRNGTPTEIQIRVLSDYEKAAESGGLNITTAGSLAAGTGLGRMRWLMQIVQDFCRYDR
jgi:uroporphyrinogen decarboxylase